MSQNADEPILTDHNVTEIMAQKRRTYTFNVLIFTWFFLLAATAVAFVNGVIVRQIINSIILLVLGIIIGVMYRQTIKAWHSYFAVFLLHVAATSGFITNGGIQGYAVVLVPLLPMVSLLLLSKKAAGFSFAYISLLCLISFLAWLNDFHPPNMTPESSLPVLGLLFTLLATGTVMVSFQSLIRATEEADRRSLAVVHQLVKEMQNSANAEVQLAKAMKAKTEFLCAMGHELRTPLNAIFGFTGLLVKEPLSERGKGCLHNVKMGATELLNKINKLLEYADSMSSKAEVNYKTLALDTFFTEIGVGFEPLAKERQLDFRVELDGLDNQYALSDFDKIRRILESLLENAFKFTHKGEVRFSVTLIRGGPLAQLVCEVRDTGVGIQDNERESIFNLFTQSDMSSSRSHEGIGLGLTLAKHYAALLGAELSFRKSEPEGSIFTLSLPVKLADNLSDRQLPSDWSI